jgi:hypothetical protein
MGEYALENRWNGVTDCAAEGNRLFLLPRGQRREKNRNKPIVTPWQPVRRMASHPKLKLAVAAFL